MDQLLSKYANLLSTKEIYGVKFDVRRIKEKPYFVKLLYQIIIKSNKGEIDVPIQFRVIAVNTLEKILKTNFKSTKEFKQKVNNYLRKNNAEIDLNMKEIKKGKRETNSDYTQKKSARDQSIIFNSNVELESWWWKELNSKCLNCQKECKQSSKSDVLVCPQYVEKEKIGG